MLKKNIKYRVVGSFYFYNRKEIKDLLCYLRLISNHKDDVSLLRIINTPKRTKGIFLTMLKISGDLFVDQLF